MADELDPSATSSDYDAQIGFSDMVDAILGGEETIKAAKETHLPKFSGETDAKYNYRLANAPFTNIYADISKNLASKPFSKELVLKEGTADQYLKLAENVDGQGNNLHVFASSIFKNGLDKGVDWILVDFTKARTRSDGRKLTVAEESEQGLRPYWVHIPFKRMKAVYSDFVAGVEVIHHARISETSKERDGFDEVTVERMRVLNRDRMVDGNGNTTGYGPATWELWEQKTIADKPSWQKIDEGPITIGVIPLVPVVLTKRTGGSWIVEPPIRDLAYMQLAEYRAEANLEWVKIMTCFPMLSISGMASKDADGKDVEVNVGPNTVFLIPQNNQGTGPAGEAEYIEPASQSIVENRAQLELTRKEMRDLGMQPLSVANLTVVTTANVSKKASSAVQAWAFLFKDALEQAWKLTAMWLNDKSFEPEIVIHTDFAVEMQEGTVLSEIGAARGRGDLSLETYLGELKRRGALDPNIDVAEEMERISQEPPPLGLVPPGEEGEVGEGGDPLKNGSGEDDDRIGKFLSGVEKAMNGAGADA